MDHIQNSHGDIAAPLLPFIHISPQPSVLPQKTYMLPVVSNRSISFVTTPEMKTVLRQSLEQRFNIVEGIGHLHPCTTHPCSECGEEGQWSEEEYWSHTTSIVCSNQVFKAEGKQQNISDLVDSVIVYRTQIL